MAEAEIHHAPAGTFSRTDPTAATPVADWVAAQVELGELARSFNTMAARLREIDEMKEKFYSTVSHELRTPVTSIVGYTELLRRPLERIVDQLQQAQESVAGVARVGRLLAERPAVLGGGETALPGGPLAVELDRVGFAELGAGQHRRPSDSVAPGPRAQQHEQCRSEDEREKEHV